MECPKCGNENRDGVVFCEFCGATLVTQEELHERAWIKKKEEPAGNEPVPERETSRQSGKMRTRMEREDYVVSSDPFDDDAGMSRAGRWLIAEIVIAVLLCAAAGACYYFFLSPQSIAKNYVRARIDGNYSKVYDMLDTTEFEGELADKAAYVTAKELSDEALIGHIGEAQVTSKKDDKASVQVRIYSDENEDFLDVDMVRDGLGYKISDNSGLVKNVSVTVPAGTKLFIDAVGLGDELKKAEDGKDVYTIPAMFGNKHLVEMQLSNGEISTTTFDLSELKQGEGVDLISMFEPPVDEETMKKAADQAIVDFRELVEGAMNNKTASEIGCIASMADAGKSSMIAAYETLRDHVFGWTDEKNHTMNLTLSNTESKAVLKVDGEKKTISVTVHAEYAQKDHTLEPFEGDYDYSGTCDSVLMYQLDGDKLVLQSGTLPGFAQ